MGRAKSTVVRREWGREGVEWRTGRGELEYPTCSQVEEGGGVGLGLLCWGLDWKATAA